MRKIHLMIIFTILITPIIIMAQEASVIGDPPPPFEPDPSKQYSFPSGQAAPQGDPWLNLPPIDYTPPPYARVLKGLRIALDPGHGGDGHLKGYKSTASGYREAIMNLTVATHLCDFLTRSGATVVMTRNGDYDLKTKLSDALAARAEVASINNCDFFISMHHNAHSRKDANYPSVFYHAYPGYPYSNVDLGRHIVMEIEYWMRIPEFANTGLYSDYLIYPDSGFGVLRNVKVPAILVEASFFSNAEEEMRLKDPEYLKREAWAYYMGIVKYVRAGLPKAQLVYPADGILSGPEHKIQLKLEDGCPEGWGAKAAPRVIQFSINLTINDTNVPFDYDKTTGILTWTAPQTLPPGLYNVLVRYINMHGNSNVPVFFPVTVPAQ